MKLHPLSVPYRSIQSATGLFGVLIVVGFVAGQIQSVYTGVLVGGAIIIGLIGVVAWQVAYYRRFEYQLTSDTFDIASGVISRRQREIPYRRIQNVDISRTLVQRALGIAEVRLETAGGTQSEAHLRYVGYDEAKRLQDEVKDRTRRLSGDTAIAAESTPTRAREPLFAITDRELVILGIASYDLRVASFVAVLFSVTAPSAIYSLLFELPVEPLVVIAAFLLLALVLSGILSGGSAIFNNYGFTLTRSGDELRYERGLLQRYDGSIPLDKVQTLIVRENVIKRYFGYASLTLETAGYAPGQQGTESASVVPISNRERTMAIAREIEPVGELSFSRPARRARQRYAFRYAILAVVLTAIAWATVEFGPVEFAWYLIALGLPLAPLAAHVKWAHRGYAVTEDHVVTRDGFWRRRTHIVPYYRIQTVDEVQSILQRRWRIATVVIDTAGSSGIVAGNPTAYDLDDVEASDFRLTLGTELQESLTDRKLAPRQSGRAARRTGGVRGVW